MGIKSSSFGSVTLTDKEAKVFARQIKSGRPNKAAYETVAKGKPLVEEFNKKGYVVVSVKDKMKK